MTGMKSWEKQVFRDTEIMEIEAQRKRFEEATYSMRDSTFELSHGAEVDFLDTIPAELMELFK